MTENYSQHIDNLMGMLGQSHALGREIDLNACVTGLIPDRPENRRVRDFVVKVLKQNGRDFDRAMHFERVRAELGSVPRTAREFVNAYAEKKRITARYSGLLRQNELPYVLNADGTRQYISPALWQTDDFKTLIRSKFQRTIQFDELQQALRVAAAELRLDFSASMINDASDVWYNDVCRDRLWQIASEVEHSDLQAVREGGQASLRRLAETCFANPEGVDFVVAVLNKFIWQVKRKIEEMPIYDHLMPVILGPQGAGKSTLVRKLLEPIEELWTPSNFRMITDDRNIALWRFFVIFLDEMSHAKKADIETTKNVVTAPTLTRRPMRTNASVEVAQNATFIGCANESELGELIRDPTGIRRFVSLILREQPDYAIINEIDWLEVWRSVDHKAADPMAPFKAMLKSRQESERLKSPVENWLLYIDPKKDFNGQLLRRRFLSTDLHTAFREFEEARFPGMMKTNLQKFIQEMKHLAVAENAQFRYQGSGGYIMWEWVAR